LENYSQMKKAKLKAIPIVIGQEDLVQTVIQLQADLQCEGEVKWSVEYRNNLLHFQCTSHNDLQLEIDRVFGPKEVDTAC
jgi:hypothetical protein